MSFDVAYVNPRTGGRWSAAEPMWRAPDDGGYLNLEAGGGISPAGIDQAARSLWRYASAIRLPHAAKVTLGEGWTPLLQASWGAGTVYLKAEHLMPSGSFKDRGTAVMINYLEQVGVGQMLEDSSGNAGASIATYAAAAGLECRILIPASAPAGKRIQIAAMGAEVVPVEGTRDDVAAQALQEAETAFYSSHNWQAFFLEGTKTLAFELWEQLGFRVPDAVVVPLGNGSNVLGCHIGFSELKACGEIDRVPRIYGVQAANCAPFHATLATGGEELVEIRPTPTLADGIASAKPIRVADTIRALRESGGGTVAVSEPEIVEAFRRLARLGQFVEPTAAAGAAGLDRLLADGAIRQEERTVLVLTGTGLKATAAIGTMLGL